MQKSTLSGSVLCFTFCVISICMTGSYAQAPCAQKGCNATTQYCVEQVSGVAECNACHASCVGCTGPASTNCIQCAIGFIKADAVPQSCTACADGKYGTNCASTCNCLNPDECDKVTGNCKDFMCQIGYQNPSKCDQECTAGTFGSQCLNECHCSGNNQCHHVNGDCPSKECHPDYTGAGCQDRLPKLTVGPTIVSEKCGEIKLKWTAFSTDNDIGKGPIGRYVLYQNLNGTDDWTVVANIDPTTALEYDYTVNNNLAEDAYYRFRVDVVLLVAGKLSLRFSSGIPSVLAFTLCTKCSI